MCTAKDGLVSIEDFLKFLLNLPYLVCCITLIKFQQLHPGFERLFFSWKRNDLQKINMIKIIENVLFLIVDVITIIYEKVDHFC